MHALDPAQLAALAPALAFASGVRLSAAPFAFGLAEILRADAGDDRPQAGCDAGSMRAARGPEPNRRARTARGD